MNVLRTIRSTEINSKIFKETVLINFENSEEQKTTPDLKGQIKTLLLKGGGVSKLQIRIFGERELEQDVYQFVKT